VRDEKIYHEYANWKIEHHDLFKYLAESDSGLFIRFKHVLDVTDFLYDKLIDDVNYSDDEHSIFESGFYYIFDQVVVIDDLLQKSFKHNVKELESHAKDVNLLLTVLEFKNELLGMDDFEQIDLDKLETFEKVIMQMIEKKQVVSEEKFVEFDHLTEDIFSKFEDEFYPTYNIFLDIADELGIL